MLRVNKKLEYGVIALLYLASDSDKVASVREMSEVCHVPEALLSKVMQRLKSKGFVLATHGNHGGYQLGKNLAEINLLDLTHALVGPVMVAECLEAGNETCPAKASCTIVTPMSLLNEKIIRLFEGTSLESLVSRKATL